MRTADEVIGREVFVGDKGGKKEKEKSQKQHAIKNKQEEQAKLNKQPKRPSESQ